MATSTTKATGTSSMSRAAWSACAGTPTAGGGTSARGASTTTTGTLAIVRSVATEPETLGRVWQFGRIRHQYLRIL
ncbi:MAG: hypothetical protein JWN49_332 [Parcubacteria group bacterium]|nr:hypothetical protein [Parcubacteria group bacterium]